MHAGAQAFLGGEVPLGEECGSDGLFQNFNVRAIAHRCLLISCDG